MEQDNSELAAQIYAQQRNAVTLRQVLGENHPHIRKLTLSMALAQATDKVEQKLPPSTPNMPKSSKNLEKESFLLNNCSTMG